MKRQEPALTWVVDYSAAHAHAMRWLGDRYLLAQLINTRRYGWRPPTPGLILATAPDRLGVPQRIAKQ